ncbi:hypothetical protein BX600DRAFT_462999 [Xylariales sp. PMI_506]|nr:hypothetical protein BX600DRAFT_462999 [Xylariales sp. PMI_506]
MAALPSTVFQLERPILYQFLLCHRNTLRDVHLGKIILTEGTWNALLKDIRDNIEVTTLLVSDALHEVVSTQGDDDEHSEVLKPAIWNDMVRTRFWPVGHEDSRAANCDGWVDALRIQKYIAGVEDHEIPLDDDRVKYSEIYCECRPAWALL